MDRNSALLELGLERVEPARPVCRSIRVDRDHHRVFTVRPAMGTLVSVVAIHHSGARAEEAIESAFVEMDRLIGILSRHDASSPVTQLNATGTLASAPAELAQVVGRALRYHRLTGGAFDITLKPLVDLYENAARPPGRAERAEASELVGAEHLHLSGRRLRFDRSGMGITLDGIAKGYVVDVMSEVLTRHGVCRFLVNAGGDIRASGFKEDGKPWTIAVRDPSRPESHSDVLEMTDGAVATSGNYEKEYRHLLGGDPDRPPGWSASVSVIAGSAMEADALATALFVMDPAAGRQLARTVPGCDYLALDARGAAAASAGWTRASRGEQHE